LLSALVPPVAIGSAVKPRLRRTQMSWFRAPVSTAILGTRSTGSSAGGEAAVTPRKTIPLARPAASSAAVVAAFAGKTALPAGKGERILVVDDEESVLAMTRAALGNYGYLVSTAVSGMEAVARFREDPGAIDLVITDFAMPFMDGPAMIPVLRKIRPDIKIIVASGSEDPVENLSKNFKIDGFVLKPFTTEGLLTIVRQSLVKK